MCIFPAMEGVCDTPLHIFVYFMGNAMVERCDLTNSFHPTKNRFPQENCRGVSHTPSCERKRNQHATQHSPKINRTGVGAYRIRPQMSGNEMMLPNMTSSFDVHFPRHGGRMRYAPTVFGLKHGRQHPRTNRDDGNMKHTTPSNESRRTFK